MARIGKVPTTARTTLSPYTMSPVLEVKMRILATKLFIRGVSFIVAVGPAPPSPAGSARDLKGSDGPHLIIER